jgi:SagB-type dehydrogenase family enzyme
MKLLCPPALSLLSINGALQFRDPVSLLMWAAEDVVELAQVLSFCNRWTEREHVVGFLSEVLDLPPEEAEAAIDRLIVHRLLWTERDPESHAVSAAHDAWSERQWLEPFVFHAHTNRLPKMDYALDPRGEADKALMRERLTTEASPPQYKDIVGARVPLRLDTVAARPVDEVFTAGSGEAGPPRRMSFAELSWLARLGFGQTATRKLQITGEHVAKTSPSGGSRHPTEVYLFALDVDAVDEGLYHYNVRDHALVLLRGGAFMDFVREHVITHPTRPAFRPTVACVFTTIFERSMFRYRESRSYRVMHFDLGHLLQTFALLASGVGRPAYRGYSFHDGIVDEMLGIDGLSEASMAFALIG